MPDPYATAHHIRAALHTIDRSYGLALTGTAPRDDNDHHPHRDQAPPPVSPHILDVRAEAFADLAYYARFILGEVNQGTITTRVGLSVDAMCQFIQTWAQTLAEQHPADAEQARTDLGTHARKLAAIVNGDYTSRMVIFAKGTPARCPQPVWAGETITACTGQLVAYVRHGDAPLPPGVRCDTHPEHAWAPHEWPALGRRISA